MNNTNFDKEIMAIYHKHMTKKQKISIEKKFEDAKGDFNKLISEIEPFIRKSDIILTSTEGKWYDTTTTNETVLIQNFSYR